MSTHAHHTHRTDAPPPASVRPPLPSPLVARSARLSAVAQGEGLGGLHAGRIRTASQSPRRLKQQYKGSAPHNVQTRHTQRACRTWRGTDGLAQSACRAGRRYDAETYTRWRDRKHGQDQLGVPRRLRHTRTHAHKHTHTHSRTHTSTHGRGRLCVMARQESQATSGVGHRPTGPGGREGVEDGMREERRRGEERPSSLLPPSRPCRCVLSWASSHCSFCVPLSRYYALLALASAADSPVPTVVALSWLGPWLADSGLP